MKRFQTYMDWEASLRNPHEMGRPTTGSFPSLQNFTRIPRPCRRWEALCAADPSHGVLKSSRGGAGSLGATTGTRPRRILNRSLTLRPPSAAPTGFLRASGHSISAYPNVNVGGVLVIMSLLKLDVAHEAGKRFGHPGLSHQSQEMTSRPVRCVPRGMTPAH